MAEYILITGSCGTGKTWIMRGLRHLYKPMLVSQHKLYHWVANDGVALLGKYEDTMFDGSDRLAMNIMSNNGEVKPLLDDYDYVIAEGDRFTNKTFIEAFKPTILKIKGDGAEGRKMRGSNQTERQVKSIATRVNNIIPHYEFPNSEACVNFIVRRLNGINDDANLYEPPKTTLF